MGLGAVRSVGRVCEVNRKPSDDRAVKPVHTTQVFLRHGQKTMHFGIALCKDLTTANGNRVASTTVLRILDPITGAGVA